MVLLCKKV